MRSFETSDRRAKLVCEEIVRMWVVPGTAVITVAVSR